MSELRSEGVDITSQGLEFLVRGGDDWDLVETDLVGSSKGSMSNLQPPRAILLYNPAVKYH